MSCVVTEDDLVPAVLCACLAILLFPLAFRVLASLCRRSDRSQSWKRQQPNRSEQDRDDGSRLHPITSFGAWGRADGCLNSPRFLLPVEGGVLVADSGNDRLQVFTADGTHVRTILGSRPGHPTGLATDGTHAWVADSSNCSVAKIVLKDGALVTRTGSYGSGVGEFSAPEGLALAHGVLFVADEGNCRVAMLDAASLAWRGAFGTRGVGPGQLLKPVGLTVVDNGDRLELFVRDTQNHRVQVFDVSGANAPGVCGTFVRAFGERGDAPAQFQQPSGMAVDPLGRILVSEAGAGRVQMLTLQGAPLQVLRLPTAGKLYGMCVSGTRVFVADYERHQVHVLQLASGTPSSPPTQPW